MKSRPAIPRGRLALLLGALAMFGAFSIDTIFPAFPALAADFDASKLQMQQTISVYLIAYAAMSLLHGPLSDAFGRKRIILGGVAIFICGSIGCALSTNMTQMLAFRALQGLSAGVGLIVGRAVIRDCLDGNDAQRLMAQVSMIFGVAPAIAPVIGGWIIGWTRWPGIFWFLVLFGAAIFTATLAWLPETHPRRQRVPVHPRSMWQSNRMMLGNGVFVRLALAGTFNFGAMFLYIASAPAFVLGLMGLDEQQFAWFFVPTISGMMAGAWCSGRMAGRISGRRMANIGFMICGTAAALNLAYNLVTGDLRPPALNVGGIELLLPLAVLPVMVNAFGVALVFPILTLAILDMYPRQRGAASSLQAFISLTSNAIIAGALSPLVSDAGLHLALAATAFIIAAWLLWWSYTRSARTTLAVSAESAEAAALEPAERM